MEKTLENIIINNKNGLFLLDPPTGFGKTTAVINLIRRYLKGDECFSKVKRIFFVTNLITNLPYEDLLDGLTDDEKSKCFRAKATIDYVLERFLTVEITENEVRNSKECKDLRREIESYQFLIDKLDKANEESEKAGIRKNLSILKQKISTDTERAFRNFIKTKFFFNKSIQAKKNFIKDNGWFRSLYPICDIEKYKVIFLTTRKFISPMDTFVRLPFYTYCDSLTDNAVVFFDEFDSTKKTVLNQIIEDGLKNQIDIVSLFLKLHFALHNFTFPQKLLRTSTYHQKKVESGEWYTTQWHFDHWKEEFEKKYKEHNINYLIKSVDFVYDRAFLFDDGKYFNVVKDSSKIFIYAEVDKKEDILSLRGQSYDFDKKQINTIIKDLEYCIDGFTQAVFYVSNNYMYYKNEGKSREDTKFTLEEAIYTVLDSLNLSEDEKKYLFNKIQTGDLIFNKPSKDSEMRRGFNFTEIEDSNYHDMKSVVHKFDFPTTPEDVIIKLADRALVVGISATAKIKTCIENYDIDYLSKKLNERMIDIDESDERRIADNFDALIKKLFGQYQIHTSLVDDFQVFSDKEKCAVMIQKIFGENKQEKYLKILEDKKTSGYYYFIELKIAYLYKQMGTSDIYSFIAFVNSFPVSGGKFDSDRLVGMFKDLEEEYGFSSIRFEIINAQTFDDKFKSVKKDLIDGKKVFVLTTYQTIGSGKNIQYSVPLMLKDNVVLDSEDTRETKDFDGIYLLTPTNLLQRLSYDSENRYKDLANYLFQQEYLYQNKYLTYYQMKFNIANGFRKTFFYEDNAFYPKNGDMYLSTLKIAIQAIGRICRCRNKNKDIYIFSDKEVVERIQTGYEKSKIKLLNAEFKALLSMDGKRDDTCSKLVEYSRQSKKAYTTIKYAAYTVRNSAQNISQWKYLRDYVLKNPTAENPEWQFKNLYFEFDEAYTGYSYAQNSHYDFEKIIMDIRYDMNQVSEASCDLPVILSFHYIEKMFDEKGYCKKFKPAHFLMSPSLFKQVYLGALGEVVGECILRHELGWDLEKLEDISFYEYFDFKLGNIYFDFKHWDEFRIDNAKYVQKVEKKLSKIKGAKCFVINLIKRTEAASKENIGETVVQISYLIDGERGVLNDEAIEYIGELYES